MGSLFLTYSSSDGCIYPWMGMSSLCQFGWYYFVYGVLYSCLECLQHRFGISIYVFVLKMARSSFILYMSAFFHKNIFLRTGVGLNGLHAISSMTISGSLFPIDGSAVCIVV